MRGLGHRSDKVHDAQIALLFARTRGGIAPPATSQTAWFQDYVTTTNTLAHLDAVLGAGTGFGGVAVDPRRGSFFGTVS